MRKAFLYVLILLLLCFVPDVFAGSYSIVQQGSSSSTSAGSSLAVPITATTVGDTIFVLEFDAFAYAPSTPTDAHNTYTLIGSGGVGGGNAAVALYWAKNTSSITSVTANFSNSGDARAAIALDVSGLGSSPAVDQISPGVSSPGSTTMTTGNTSTTLNADDFILEGFTTDGNSTFSSYTNESGSTLPGTTSYTALTGGVISLQGAFGGAWAESATTAIYGGQATQSVGYGFGGFLAAMKPGGGATLTASDSAVSGDLTSDAVKKSSSATIIADNGNPIGAHQLTCNGTYDIIERDGTPAVADIVNNNFTLQLPTGIQNNDCVFAQVILNTSGTLTTPIGWSLVNSKIDGSNHEEYLFEKLWQTGNATSQAFSTSGGVGIAASSAYSGCDPTPYIASSTSAWTSSGPFTTAGVTPYTTSNDMLVNFFWVFGSNSQTWSSPSVGTIWAQSHSGTAEGNASFAINDNLPTANPDTGDTISLSVAAAGGSIQTSIKPASCGTSASPNGSFGNGGTIIGSQTATLSSSATDSASSNDLTSLLTRLNNTASDHASSNDSASETVQGVNAIIDSAVSGNSTSSAIQIRSTVSDSETSNDFSGGVGQLSNAASDHATSSDSASNLISPEPTATIAKGGVISALRSIVVSLTGSINENGSIIGAITTSGADVVSISVNITALSGFVTASRSINAINRSGSISNGGVISGSSTESTGLGGSISNGGLISALRTVKTIDAGSFGNGGSITGSFSLMTIHVSGSFGHGGAVNSSRLVAISKSDSINKGGTISGSTTELLGSVTSFGHGGTLTSTESYVARPSGTFSHGGALSGSTAFGTVVHLSGSFNHGGIISGSSTAKTVRSASFSHGGATSGSGVGIFNRAGAFAHGGLFISTEVYKPHLSAAFGDGGVITGSRTIFESAPHHGIIYGIGGSLTGNRQIPNALISVNAAIDAIGGALIGRWGSATSGVVTITLTNESTYNLNEVTNNGVYPPGNSIRLKANLYDQDTEPPSLADPDSIEVSLTDAAGMTVLAPTSMIRDSAGRYEYDWQSQTNDMEGQYYETVIAIIAGNLNVQTTQMTLTSHPLPATSIAAYQVSTGVLLDVIVTDPSVNPPRLVDPNTLIVSVIDPAGTVVLDPVAMVLVSQGRYEQFYQSSTASVTGYYTMTLTSVIGGVTNIVNAIKFRLTTEPEASLDLQGPPVRLASTGLDVGVWAEPRDIVPFSRVALADREESGRPSPQ